jgi:tripartite-type tricarboxylate transporter receptor subunit TctC
MRTCVAAVVAVAFTCAVPAHADEYPSRLIRLIQPLGPGSPGDILSRAIADSLGRSFNQPTIVENKVGANGIIGMSDCARAAPDGYTLCVPSFAQMTVNPVLNAKMPYDTQRDLAPVILVGAITSCITVNADLPVHSLAELIALAKQKPGVLNWGSWGIGSFSHLTLAWLANATGTSFTHVPYKTLGQAVQSVVAGEVQVMVNTPAVAKPFVDAGKVRVLAIIGPQRSPLLDAPTLKELGYDLPVLSWVGVVAPAKTPKEIVARLNGEINKSIADPKFVERFMTPSSLAPFGGSAEKFATFLASERAAMEKLAADANIPRE